MEDKLKDKLEAEDKDKVGAALKEALEWLEENSEVEKEDYEEKLKEVQDVCGPIISKVYAQSGGADGGSGGEEDDLGDHDGEGPAAVEWVQFKRLRLVRSMDCAACLTAQHLRAACAVLSQACRRGWHFTLPRLCCCRRCGPFQPGFLPIKSPLAPPLPAEL